MADSREDFEIILNECLADVSSGQSRTLAVADPAIQAGADKLVDEWTKPALRAADEEEKLGNMSIIPYPDKDSFTDEDAVDITRVRSLGRTILDVAKQSLLANPHYANATRTYSELGLAFDFMAIERWYEVRPEIGTEIASDYRDSKIADPNRLKEWPKGDALNCLGSAIGAAAICEIQGMEYLFGSELRTGEAALAEQHVKLKATLERLHPGIFTKNYGKILMSNFEIFRKTRNKRYANLFFKDEEDLRPPSQLRNFHHFVVRREKNGLRQVDPYSPALF